MGSTNSTIYQGRQIKVKSKDIGALSDSSRCEMTALYVYLIPGTNFLIYISNKLRIVKYDLTFEETIYKCCMPEGKFRRRPRRGFGPLMPERTQYYQAYVGNFYPDCDGSRFFLNPSSSSLTDLNVALEFWIFYSDS